MAEGKERLDLALVELGPDVGEGDFFQFLLDYRKRWARRVMGGRMGQTQWSIETVPELTVPELLELTLCWPER